MFERFTPEAKAVLVASQDAAIELGSEFITPGHIFYGCAAGRESTAGEPLHELGITAEGILDLLPRNAEISSEVIDVNALRAIGIDFDGVRNAVEETFGRGALESAPDRRTHRSENRRPPFTVESKRSLEFSLRVALELHDDDRMRPGHLLLGLIRLRDEFVSCIVQQSGSTIASLSATVLQRLDN